MNKGRVTQSDRLILGRALRSPPDLLGPKEVRALIDEASAAVERLETRLAKKNEEVATATRPTKVSWVRKGLPKDAALVEIVVIDQIDPGLDDPYVDSEPYYAAFVLKATGQPRVVALDEAEWIDDSARALRDAIANRSPDIRGEAQALYRLVMSKIEPLVGEARTLIISPDGELAQVPFEAMMGPDGRWLVERYALSYVTTGRDLVRLSGRTGAPSKPVLVGDINYDLRPAKPADVTVLTPTTLGPTLAETSLPRRSADRALGATKWKSLGGAAEEVDDLTRNELMTGALLITRDRATEAALRALRGPRILHIATHGFFEPDQPEPSSVAPEEMGLPTPPTENPLLRSGLALAGANRTDYDANGDDGELTAYEAASLDLDGTELVVLSACETAIGEAKLRDGVHGLQRAFVLAGARTLVMSLWQVDDDATRALMVAYYQRLANGEGRAEAMRQVRLALLDGKMAATDLASGSRSAVSVGSRNNHFPDWTHPYYWASFIVSGETLPLSKVAPR